MEHRGHLEVQVLAVLTEVAEHRGLAVLRVVQGLVGHQVEMVQTERMVQMEHPVLQEVLVLMEQLVEVVMMGQIQEDGHLKPVEHQVHHKVILPLTPILYHL